MGSNITREIHKLKLKCVKVYHLPRELTTRQQGLFMMYGKEGMIGNGL